MKDRFMFRAWDNTYKQFIFRTLFEAKETSLEWEQCTGLKDKNGKLIYEGDIVRQISKREPEYEEYITEVEWSVFGCSLYNEESFDFEVIGNIHENEDLL